MDLGGHRGNPLGERRVGLYEISQPTALLLDMATLRIGNLMVGGLVTVGLSGFGRAGSNGAAYAACVENAD